MAAVYAGACMKEKPEACDGCEGAAWAVPPRLRPPSRLPGYWPIAGGAYDEAAGWAGGWEGAPPSKSMTFGEAAGWLAVGCCGALDCPPRLSRSTGGCCGAELPPCMKSKANWGCWAGAAGFAGYAGPMSNRSIVCGYGAGA